MGRKHTALRVATMIGLAAWVTPFSSALPAQESQWQQVLRQQLREEQSCEVNYWTSVFEGDIAGEKQVSARAHCLDGRSFDAKRERQHEKFTLTACEPTYC